MNIVHAHITDPNALHVIARLGTCAQSVQFPDGSYFIALEPYNAGARSEIAQINGAAVIPHPHSQVKLNGLEKTVFPHLKLTAANTIYDAFTAMGYGGLLHPDA